jgi:hypothetical protein
MHLFPKTSPERLTEIIHPEALSYYTEVLEALRSEYFTDERASVAEIIRDWKEFRGGKNFVKADFELRAILGRNLDLGLINALQEEGIGLEKVSKKGAYSAYEDAKRIVGNLKSVGLSGLYIPPLMTDAELKGVFEHVYERLLFPVFSHDETQLLLRVKEMRRTNPQMHSLVKQIAHYNFTNLLGRSNPEVVRAAPTLADLMGMNNFGSIDFQTWSGNHGSFKTAAEQLFLINPEKASKKVTRADEDRHFGHVKEFGMGLSALPAQVFVLKGEDPQKIYDTLVDKLTYLYTYRHGEHQYLTDLAKCHAKMAFIPFPRLWPSLGINPENFLGMEVGPTPSHDLPFSSEDNLAWFGMNRLVPMDKVSKALAWEGIDLTDPKHAARRGYGSGYVVDIDKLPPGMVDKIIEMGFSDINQVPNVFAIYDTSRSGSDLLEKSLVKGLTSCSPENAVKLLVKVLHENTVREISSNRNHGIIDKRGLMHIVKKNLPNLFDQVFDAILNLKKPKVSVIDELLKFGNPSPDKLNRLPETKLAQVLERDLGL